MSIHCEASGLKSFSHNGFPLVLVVCKYTCNISICESHERHTESVQYTSVADTEADIKEVINFLSILLTI